MDDRAAFRQELARIYGAKLEVDALSGARQFAVTTSSARARLLSADPRVIEVVEVPPTTPPPSQTPASSAHFKPRPSGYGDNGQSGTYTYDGSGNITAIGADTYVYDSAQRLVSSVTRGVQENYTYDAYGNRKSATGAVNCLGQTNCAQTVTVDSNTNHITTINGAAVTYDAAGNISTIAATSTTPGAVYSYDALGMMTRATVGTDDRQFLYNGDDERIAVRQGVSWTWMIRDQSGEVLREFASLESGSGPTLAMTNWQWAKDYVWRDGLLLATVSPSGTLHYHLDHLGTPRLVTDANGVKVAEHAYYPFGAEINLTPHETPEEAMKFTGHERDIVAGDGHTLDYMHARYYSPTVGRFLSVDPNLNGEQSTLTPQKWNRYAYADNNPIKNLDANGRETVVFIVGPGSGSRERGGHAAVWVERGGQHAGISKGGFDLEKYGWKAFLGHYAAEGREVHAYVLKTSAESENAMIKFVKDEGPSAGTSDDRSIATCGLSENCAKGVVNTLQAGGVLPANTDPSAVYGTNSPFVLKGALDTGVLKPVVEQHIDFVPSPSKENWFMRVWHSITQ